MCFDTKISNVKLITSNANAIVMFHLINRIKIVKELSCNTALFYTSIFILLVFYMQTYFDTNEAAVVEVT